MPIHSTSDHLAQDYLTLERLAETKSEYRDGEMLAMPQSGHEHHLIITNVAVELSQQVKRRPFEVYASAMRLHVPATGLYTYPDVSVASSEPRFEDDQFDTLLNPTLIVEVLSPTTESYDRGKKFEHYRALDSLAEYLLVSQDELLVEQFVRQTGGTWLFTATAGREGVVQLPSIGCTLALSEVYDKVPLA